MYKFKGMLQSVQKQLESLGSESEHLVRSSIKSIKVFKKDLAINWLSSYGTAASLSFDDVWKSVDSK
jgi:hypothetical protein